jgi:hypothetical protein
MSNRFLETASRVIPWLTVGFAALAIALGAAFWLAGDGKDVGGMMGVVFISAGVLLAASALSHALRRKK